MTDAAARLGTQPRKFTTRALLACVVLGALGAVLALSSRFLSLTLQGTVPWLAFPAPLPWFLSILVAALLIQRTGAALLTSIITTVLSFGALSLCAGIVVELAFLAVRRVQRRDDAGLPPTRSRFLLWWTFITATLVSLMSYGFMFLYQEFLLLDSGVKLLAFAIRTSLGLLYAWLAWLVAIGLLRAGVNPQRIALA